MGNKSGVWLDTKKAIVVKLSEGHQKVNVIESGIESRERVEGEGKKFGRFARQFLSFENRKQRRRSKQEKDYFEQILKSLKGVEQVVLFGPASAKIKFQKELEAHHNLPFEIKGVEDADSMTDNQVTAWVREFYNK